MPRKSVRATVVTLLLLWLGAWLSLMVVFTLFGSQLAELPLAVHLGLVAAILVLVMSQLVIPAVTNGSGGAVGSLSPDSSIKRAANPTSVAQGKGLFTHVVEVDNATVSKTVYISGQVAWNASGDVVGAG